MVEFDTIVNVKIDGKQVGQIRQFDKGFGYVPKGRKKPDEVFATLGICKHFLVVGKD